MRAVVQRVAEAHVDVDGERVGAIGKGLLVFLAVEKGDGDAELEKMVAKVARLRIFYDDAGKMNLNVDQVDGGVLVISQFTLAADLKKGYRPSFSRAEAPEKANAMYETFCDRLKGEGVTVEKGVFAADMQVGLINDGPVTIWLDFPPPAP